MFLIIGTGIVCEQGTYNHIHLFAYTLNSFFQFFLNLILIIYNSKIILDSENSYTFLNSFISFWLFVVTEK